MSGCVRLLRDIHPELFSGLLTPKTEEMVVSPIYALTTLRQTVRGLD